MEVSLEFSEIINLMTKDAALIMNLSGSWVIGAPVSRSMKEIRNLKITKLIIELRAVYIKRNQELYMTRVKQYRSFI